MTKFERVFGERRPVIGMGHLGALPGSPLHDAEGGTEAIVAAEFADSLDRRPLADRAHSAVFSSIPERAADFKARVRRARVQ